MMKVVKRKEDRLKRMVQVEIINKRHKDFNKKFDKKQKENEK